MKPLDTKTREVALVIAGTLWRTSVLGFGCLILLSLLVLLLSDQLHAFHNWLLLGDLPQGEYRVLLFEWLGRMELYLFLFLLLALGIRWTINAGCSTKSRSGADDFAEAASDLEEDGSARL